MIEIIMEKILHSLKENFKPLKKRKYMHASTSHKVEPSYSKFWQSFAIH